MDDSLAARNIGLAHWAVSRVRSRRADREDLTGEALLALVHLARRYDPARGATFASFAGVSILRRCWRAVQRGDLVRLPDNTTGEQRRALARRCSSLDAPRRDGRRRELPAGGGESVQELAARRELAGLVREAVQRVCSPREAEVIWRRMQGQSLQQVADVLNVSKERVRQVEEGALEELGRHAQLRQLAAEASGR